jgi:hypothetical protein
VNPNVSSVTVLQLSDDLIVGRGNRRFVYVHPANPARCLKIGVPERAPEIARRNAGGFNRWRPLRYYDDSYLEWREYQRLARKGPARTAFLPAIEGFVATNRGPALLEELIRDADGAVSLNLRDFLRHYRHQPELIAPFRGAVARFVEWLVAYRVIVRDLNLLNTVVQRSRDGFRVVLIDGLGSKSLLPYYRYLPPLAARRVKAKTGKFLNMVTEELQGPAAG